MPRASCASGWRASPPRSSARARLAASEVRFVNDAVWLGDTALPFGEVVAKAYLARVQLWSDGFYATPKLYWDQAKLQGRPFYYYAYGAAVSEVVIDTLTGEMRVLRADALHDVGASLNPALDIGQVEGAFIQGMGWLTTEELWWNTGGKLMTHAPSTYKIPTVNDTPPEFNVELFRNRNVEDSIHRSKAVGEPPLLLPFSVFFAVRDAVASGRRLPRAAAAERAGHRRGDPQGGAGGARRAHRGRGSAHMNPSARLATPARAGRPAARRGSPHPAPMHVVLFGAGHVGHALVTLLAHAAVRGAMGRHARRVLSRRGAAQRAARAHRHARGGRRRGAAGRVLPRHDAQPRARFRAGRADPAAATTSPTSA